jgi:Ca2+-binding EF-hand superfamily protein
MAVADAKKMIADSFDHLDLDHNGFLEEQDFVRYGEEVIRQFDCSPDSPKARKFIEGTRQTWRRMQSAVDEDNDQKISRDEFARHQENVSPEELDAFADSIFELADDDDNGELTKEEFAKLQRVRGENSADHVEKVFNQYDQDKDGVLTRSEYRKYLQDHLS